MDPDGTAVVRPDVTELLGARLFGQPSVIASIMPYVQMFQAGLAPAGRPAGIFLLLGPTGTGKTRTVEALAEVLHGSAGHLLRIDCGEFQAEHEVAKLLGAPPGYIGHRESQPMLTQHKLAEITSPGCGASLVLFDEIEKAAPSLTTLLLGLLDKASLRLGDGSAVNFEKSLIFLTSNLGAREMMREIRPDIGFRTSVPAHPSAIARKLEGIGLNAVRKRFSPEFVNRIDAVITYKPLDEPAFSAILEQHVADLQQHLDARLGDRSFALQVTAGAHAFLLATGVSTEYGARELKRTVHRHLAHPLAVLVAGGDIPPGADVAVDVNDERTGLAIRVANGTRRPAAAAQATVLVVDDNEDLLEWLEDYLRDAGCRVLRAGSVEQALAHAREHTVDAAFIDHLLPDGEGVQLGVQLSSRPPYLPVVIMTGSTLPDDAQAVCRRFAFPVLTKPFPGRQMLNLLDLRRIRSGGRAKAAG